MLLGSFVTIFIMSMYALLNVQYPAPTGGPRGRNRPNRRLLLSSVLLFTLITVVRYFASCIYLMLIILRTKDWILETIRAFSGWVTFRDSPGSVVFFSNGGEPKNVAHAMMDFLEILLADSILVSRSMIIISIPDSLIIDTPLTDLPDVCHLEPQTTNYNISRDLLGSRSRWVSFYSSSSLR